MKTKAKLLVAALALSAIPLLYACGTTDPKPLSVSPVYTKLYVGQMVQLQATTTDGRDPEEVLGGPVMWSSTDAFVAEVSDDGWVRGLRPGLVSIAAGCQDYCGAARVMVLADPGSDEEGPPGGPR